MILFLHVVLLIFCFFSLTNNFEIINFMIDKFFAFLNYFYFFEKILIDDYRNILKEILYILSERVNFILFFILSFNNYFSHFIIFKKIFFSISVFIHSPFNFKQFFVKLWCLSIG